MLGLYNRDGTRKFLLDINDGGGGGASGDTGATGSTGAGGGDDKIVTPFDHLDLNEFDEDTRKELEKAKTDFVATLQQGKKRDAELVHQQVLARRFQSEADRARQELDKARPKQRKDEPDPYLEIAKKELKDAKYDDANIEKLAPMFANMARKAAEVQRKQIGADLGPLASTVLAQEATNAFQTAQHTDRTGVFQIPEVAQKVWDTVAARVQAGESTNAEIVKNLGKMVFMDYAQAEQDAGREVKFPNGSALPKTPPNMNHSTGFNYPGFGGASHLRPAIPPVQDPNAARTALNEDTRIALESTFGHLKRETGVAPKAFGGTKK